MTGSRSSRTGTRTGAVIVTLVLSIPLLGGCAGGDPRGNAVDQSAAATSGADPHSLADPRSVVVRHMSLDLGVDFERRRLAGRASLRLERLSQADTLRLDTRGLEIERVLLDDGIETGYRLSDPDPVLGRRLDVTIRPDTEWVHVDYATGPEADALLWLEPRQTAGGRHPFLFTQSQAILARTWVPCQDSPGVRFTYEAVIRVPPPLLAVMSAVNPREQAADGVYYFRMDQPIPSYLLALAVGEMEFRPLGPRTGVYAEPPVVEGAAWEFAEVESMLEAAERLYGPYRWERFDLLVLPPSFPFGGMENPRLTFATPTILTGDRSLTALVAHELAHSWSGNLVTNSTWDHFWLNEGFTSYVENRVMEEVKGPGFAEMLRVLAFQELDEELEKLGPDSPDTRLALYLAGRDPELGMTSIAYDKGAALLYLLEETVGRSRWDRYLRGYFERFAFRSIDSQALLDDLRGRLLSELPDRGMDLDLDAWVFGTGLPGNAPRPRSDELEQVGEQLDSWSRGEPAEQLSVEGWTTQHWVYFLRRLPPELPVERLAELDGAFTLTGSPNPEILSQWLELAIRSGYVPARPVLERFLLSVGRTKFLEPLYAALAEREEDLLWARRVYERARPGYHATTRAVIEKLLPTPEDTG